MKRLIAAFILTLAIAFALPVNAQDGQIIATSKVKVGSTEQVIKSNSEGEFPQIKNVSTLSTASIEITFPGSKGGKISVSVEDGGTLGNGKGVQSISLDTTGKGKFTFKIGDQKGIYQISIRNGTDSYLMSFWAK